MFRKLIAPTSAVLGLAIFAGAAGASPVDASKLLIPAGVDTSSVATTQIASRLGMQRITVRLSGQPLAAVAGNKRSGNVWSRSRQQAHLATLKTQQDAVMAQVAALGGTELGRVSKAHNALVVSIDAKRVPQLLKIAGVTGIRRLEDYRLDLGETVPYIGAAAAQAAGVDGSGVRVAVLDSGVDFTHRNLGGPGTTAFYDTCYAGRDAAPVGDCANFFGAGAPKVVGGMDFVGEQWPSDAKAIDPNPLDFQGHGTHVADIIGGRSADGTHKGVAPGVDLYAVKVCSAVATSCNGLALLEGMDFALDPNGDGNIADAVDVANLSLGSSYGQREDDLSAAVSIASKFGVVVVISAGNSADRPFIAGSPSTTPEAISVAQTQVPSAVTYPLVVNSPASIAGSYGNTNTVPWAPITTGFTGNLRTAQAAGGVNNLACVALPAGSMAGLVALVDRGGCNISFKTHNAATAGAIGVVLANNAPGDAPSFSFGGPEPFTAAQTLVVTQAIGNTLKSGLAAGAVNVAVSPGVATRLAGSMVASSSRGPSYSYASIKPEIGAPGASVSAIAGSGSDTGAFGGTSGAAPMVSGAAALVLQKFPNLLSHEVKARLMHGAETNILTNPATQPGVLAPITRIGAGEVRVNRSLELSTGAWDAANPGAVALSFGTYRVNAPATYRKKVLVRNYANTARTYAIASSFRYANDAASGAVAVTAPGSVSVPANGTATFTLSLRVTPAALPTWNLNGGSLGGNGVLLNLPEYDGYLALSEGGETVHLPWHILPHRAANVTVATNNLVVPEGGVANLSLSNLNAAAIGSTDVFGLDGTSPQQSPAVQPKPGENFAIIDLKSVGSRLVDLGGGVFAVQFAVDTWGQRSHPNYPAEVDVYVDSDNDGNFDYVLYTTELGGFAATGQNVVTILDVNSSNGSKPPVTNFYAGADLSSSATVLSGLLSSLDLTPASKFSYQVLVFDNYFTGNLTDLSDPATVTLGSRRFVAPSGGGVAIGATVQLPVSHVPANDAASPTEQGLLLLYSNGRSGAESSAVKVTVESTP